MDNQYEIFSDKFIESIYEVGAEERDRSMHPEVGMYCFVPEGIKHVKLGGVGVNGIKSIIENITPARKYKLVLNSENEPCVIIDGNEIDDDQIKQLLRQKK